MRFTYITPFGSVGLSHFGPFLPLARELERRGHEVLFVSCDRPAPVERMGFRCRSQAEFGLPEERLDLVSAERWLDGSWDDALAQLPGDRFLVDATVDFLCLSLARLGRPSARFHITLPLGERARGWSPLGSRRQIRARGPATRLAIAMQWARLSWGWRWRELRIALAARWRGRPLRHSPFGLARALATAAGRRRNFVRFRAERPGFPWPEIVACDESLALGYSRPKLRLYLGDQLVDWGELATVPPALATLGQDRPLAYCSFGSNSGVWESMGPQLDRLRQVARAMPAWDFVVAAAERWRRDQEPGNLTWLSFAPQVELLRRATIFVTHGGMSSVREGRRLGVPMLVLPQAYDQFGNAARVEALELGQCMSSAATVGEWRAALERWAGRSRGDEERGRRAEVQAQTALQSVADFLETDPWPANESVAEPS